jgi:hypothetical protein
VALQTKAAVLSLHKMNVLVEDRYRAFEDLELEAISSEQALYHLTELSEAGP